ncbi:putative monooxygenase [Xylaria bambusicola]|uniref:putative monooxygenase n=1 Tax=Xylaria bambusicola TaxID=326684 RepID=UPI0020085D2D|nr:putative monooxygenase [Xylaria bambusicola]KAI0505877.1 putative monooxygenase [Xylaria bambusicola]
MEKETAASDSRKPFRVIVVGGGLVGITAAHILSKANIDFVILEQHDNLTPWIGSLIVLWPASYRMLAQLGILDEMLPVLNKLEDYETLNANDGSVLYRTREVGQMWERNHGHGVGCTARSEFLAVLHRTLPESAKARIRLKKRVTDIETVSDGVVVRCADGTVEEGSLVIGADGVHSRTRQCMQALATGNQQAPHDAESPYISTYRVLLGNLPEMTQLKPHNQYLAIGPRVSAQLVAGEGRAWWYLYEALSEPTRQRHRYTAEDKQAMMDKYADLQVTPDYTLRDICASNVGDIGLINLEEGSVDSWSWGGRIVLVGDAVRKLCPHAGLGYNCGAGDIVELVNRIHRVSAEGKQPSAEILQAEFDEYEKTRKGLEKTVDVISRMSARSAAWLSRMDRFMATWVMRFFPIVKWLVNYLLAPVVAREPAIEWLEETELPQGAKRWVHRPLSKVR